MNCLLRGWRLLHLALGSMLLLASCGLEEDSAPDASTNGSSSGGPRDSGSSIGGSSSGGSSSGGSSSGGSSSGGSSGSGSSSGGSSNGGSSSSGSSSSGSSSGGSSNGGSSSGGSSSGGSSSGGSSGSSGGNSDGGWNCDGSSGGGSIGAQAATVNFCSRKQLIRGFGGMNHPLWAGDLTAAQRTTAFGNGDEQLGFTIVRMFVSDNKNDWPKEVATGKAAIAAGGIAYASPWNPPASMKSGGSINPAQFAAYATHLNDYVTFMKNNGIDLYAISIQNEPDFAADWTAWTPQQIHDFIVNYRSTIQTKLITAESFQYRKNLYDQLLNDDKALANWDILGAHLYGTALKDFPYPLFDQKGAGKERWMTEHYTDSNNDADLWPMALDVGYELHNSMVEAQFNAYTWWYIRRKYGPMKEDGKISKRGYCMAQYSKFIRPGYYRVDATKNPTTDVYVSAYRGEKDVVIVAVNRSTSSKSLSLSISGADISSYDKFTTSGSKRGSDPISWTVLMRRITPSS